MTELEKYQGIYSSPAKYPKYGHSNHGAGALRLLARWNPASLLDIGCGFNEFVRAIREAVPSCHAIGVDFACPGADRIADITTGLPFNDKSIDVATAFDVMEHIPPDLVDAALREMARVSQRFVVSISYVSSVNKWRGETLHPTVRPESWWMMRLARAGAVAITKQGRYITGTWKPRLNIRPDARVILVGNGPSVLTGSQGAMIDGFEEVVRFNNYKIAGFEPHVGTKTTLWSTFFKRIDNEQHHNRVICPHEADKPPAECVEAYHIPSVYYNRIRDDVQRRAAWCGGLDVDVDHLLASSGILVAAWLLEIVGVKRLALAGFDHFDKTKSSLHHYWINKAYKQPAEHSGAIESAMFTELAKAGRIVYLQPQQPLPP